MDQLKSQKNQELKESKENQESQGKSESQENKDCKKSQVIKKKVKREALFHFVKQAGKAVADLVHDAQEPIAKFDKAMQDAGNEADKINNE